MELATRKLGEYNPNDYYITIQAKKLLQKCAYSMISHQELSAQQVASYLMDYKDHFTSHQYQNLYWISFERHINKERPSPECYPSGQNILFRDTENELELKVESEAMSKIMAHDNTTNTGLELECSDKNGDLTNYSTEMDESDEELSISVNSSGELIAQCTQIADYQL